MFRYAVVNLRKKLCVTLLGQSCSHGEHIECSPARAELAIDFACRRAAGADVRFKIVKKAVGAQCADR